MRAPSAKRARGGFALALAVFVFAGAIPFAAFAAEPAAQRAFLTVRVNGAGGGDVLVIMRGDDVLVHAEELRALGLRIPDGTIVTSGGEAFVSVKALGSGASAKVDPDALTLVISVPPGMFQPQAIPLGNDANRVAVSPKASGGFVNYGISASNDGAPALNAQLGAGVGPGVFEATFAQSGVGRNYAVSAPAFTINDFTGARRTVVGTSAIDVDDFAGLGGSVYLDGVTTRRNLQLNPNLIRQSTNAISGVAAGPSTVDVYVNGTLVRRETIAPGPFELTNVPLQGGVNQTTVVVHDAFGQTQTINRPDYLSADLLPRGQAEYAFGVGRVHGGAGDGVIAGRYQFGLRDRATLGARTYITPRLRNVGLFGALATSLGEVSFAGATSSARPDAGSALAVIDVSGEPIVTPTPALSPSMLSGRAYAVGFTRNASRSTFGVSIAGESAAYASAALSPLADRPISQVRAFAQTTIGRAAVPAQLTLAAQSAAYLATPRDRSLNLTYTRPLTNRVTATIGFGQHTIGALSRPSVTLRLDAALLRDSHVAVSTVTEDGETQRKLEFSHVDAGTFGTSYSGAIANGSVPGSTFTVEQRDRFATLDLFANQAPSQNLVQATLSGAVAYAGGRLYLSRPIQDGFGLLDLSGISGVAVKVNNDLVGRTDRQGRLFLPNLSSTTANEVQLDGEDLPPDVVIDTDITRATPSYRSGTVLRIGARHVHAYVGLLRLGGSPDAAPAFGLATVKTPHDDVVSDIGSDGRFYFDALQPGNYTMHVRWAGGSCDVRSLVVPQTTNALTNLGTQLCQQEVR